MTPTVITLIVITIAAIASFLYCNSKFMSRLALSLQTYRCDWFGHPGTRSSEVGHACEIPADSDLGLPGTLFRSQESDRRGVVLFAHESGGDRSSVMPYLDRWRRAGYDVLACDFDACCAGNGASRELPTPWITQKQVADLIAGIDFLCSETLCDRVVLMGVSRGGLIALCAAAVDNRVVAVVTDSCYACEDLIVHYIRSYAGNYSRIAPPLLALVPDAILRWHARHALLRLMSQRGADYPHPYRLFPEVRQPVLLIHGRNDESVPLHVAENLVARIPNGNLCVIDGGGHNTSGQESPQEYAILLRRFLSRLDGTPTQSGTPHRTCDSN